MKQLSDKFTRDVFDTPRRGRSSKPEAKTPAQRAKEYRARCKVKNRGFSMNTIEHSLSLLPSLEVDLQKLLDLLNSEKLVLDPLAISIVDLFDAIEVFKNSQLS